MQVPVYSATGEAGESIEVSDDVFGVAANEGLLHQALVRHLANCRLGTVETKTRSTVSGSGKKLYQQKHTGRARRGDITSPVLKGGGIAFGPHQRDYAPGMPKKMRRLAIRCALSGKAAGGALKVIEDGALKGTKTKEVASVLSTLGVAGRVLIATGEVERDFVRAAGNIASVKTTPAALLNVRDILTAGVLLMTVGAVRKAESLWAPKGVEAAAGTGKGGKS